MQAPSDAASGAFQSDHQPMLITFCHQCCSLITSSRALSCCFRAQLKDDGAYAMLSSTPKQTTLRRRRPVMHTTPTLSGRVCRTKTSVSTIGGSRSSRLSSAVVRPETTSVVEERSRNGAWWPEMATKQFLAAWHLHLSTLTPNGRPSTQTSTTSEQCTEREITPGERASLGVKYRRRCGAWLCVFISDPNEPSHTTHELESSTQHTRIPQTRHATDPAAAPNIRFMIVDSRLSAPDNDKSLSPAPRSHLS